MRSRIYCAGPISIGPIEANIKQGTDAHLALLKAGYAPLCPQLSCYLGGPTPEAMPCGTKHEDWMGADLPWVFVSDAVLRLPGESKGADMETALADQAGIPVFHTIEALFASVPPNRPNSEGDPRFHGLLAKMGRLHAKKACDYGVGVDPLGNLRASAEFGVPPWLATLVRFHDKVTRMKSYAIKRTLANEGVEDTLLDLACYALLILILHGEER